jgi:hypothetical protein
MSTLPLEVHEVLEEEFHAVHGTAPADYDAFEVKDAEGAKRILRGCGIETDDVAGVLKELVDGRRDIHLLAAKVVDASTRAARRSVVDQAFGKTIAPLSVAPIDYATFEILDGAWACSILRACDPAATPGNTEEKLAAIVNAEEKPEALAKSPVFTETGRMLLADYDDTVKSGENRRKLHRRIIEEAFCGAIKPYRDMELQRIYAALHDREDHEARTALCISGGGIRSATFALGVIQGLAGARVLDKFDYLSTVSGGGYIGSWLSSWARRDRDGIAGVQRELARADTAVDGTATLGPNGNRIPDPKREVPDTKIDPEPQPVRHLREYSNYLSPKLGLTSADTWTIAALYIRNLLLNLLVLVPILAALLAFPRLFAFLLTTSSYYQGERWLHAWVLLAAASIFTGIGFAYLGSTRPVEHGRKAEARVLLRRLSANSRFLVGCVLPLTLASISLALFWARSWTNPDLIGKRWFLWWSGAGVALMIVAPFFSYYYRTLTSSATDRKDPVGRDSSKALLRKLGYELFAALVGIATTAALLLLLAVKVFPDPLRKIVDAKDVLPMLRPITDTAPVSAMYLCLAVPLVLLVFYVQASVFVGISSKVNEEYDREWWGRAGAWLLMAALFLAAASLISVFGPVFLYRAPILLGSIGGASGLIAGLVGYSSKTNAKKDGEKSTTASAASGISSALLVPLFVVILLAAISLGTTWILQQFHEPIPAPASAWDAQFESATAEKMPIKIDNRKFEITSSVAKEPLVSVAASLGVAHMETVRTTEWPDLAMLLDVALLAYLLSRCIGVNRFSMHAFYRNRLIRAYLGASRYSRDPDAFTGFDANDNVQMYELRDELLWPSHFLKPKTFLDLLVQKKEQRDSQRGDPNESVYNKIWYHLDRVTRNKIEKDGDRSAAIIDSVTQHVNALISDRNVSIAGTNVPGEKRDIIMAAFPECLPERKRVPMHVVNTALNLTAGEKLAWQQRKAESFTVSALHSGSAYVGYRDSREYGGDDGISLGNAVTISGAAASPNMGYNSSPPTAFLLTMLNVRLGSWLGNPGIAGKNSYRLGHPTSNLKPMFAELLGSTTDTYDWIYLSDGGHFENLALYEMVLRRCRYIVVSDGGCDPTFTFEDLGNAIRKIRTDLGVPIDLTEELEMFPRSKPGEPLASGSYMAKATIRYSAIDAGGVDGQLVYLKPSVYKDNYLPRDVYNYAQQSETFPHETTANQFFTESQFESYRALGRYVINVICRNYDDAATGAKAPDALRFANVAELVKRVPLAGKRVPSIEQMEITTTKGDVEIAQAFGDGVKIRIRPSA